MPVFSQSDVGLDVGVLPYEKLNAEVGFDIIQTVSIFWRAIPAFLNFQIRYPEDNLFPGSPGLLQACGTIGTKSDVTNYNVVSWNGRGKHPGQIGKVSLGAY